MNNSIKKDNSLMKISILSLLVSSCFLILAVFGDYSGNVINVIMAYAVGVGFWLFLIIGYVIFFIINAHRKKHNGIKSSNTIKSIGIIHFFSNKIASVFDIIMLVLLALNIVFMFIPFLGQTVSIICIAGFVFSIHMHSILNGINYRYITNEGEKSK